MDRQQFIRYVECNQRAVRRFLTALCCGDTALADDLAQDTFVKAYLSCDSFREDSKFLTWIYRIAYNTFLNHRRSQQFTTGYEEATAISGNDNADSSFRYQALYTALNRLPGKERTSVLLHYMEGYSIKEIAVITESSEDAVKQHLSRGRTHLRGLLVSPY